MPTATLELKGLESDFQSTRDLTGTIDVPGATSITRVTTTPALDPSKIQYTFSNGKVNVTLDDVPPSSSYSGTLYAPLISETKLPGDDDVYRCTYENGTSFLTVGGCYPSYAYTATLYRYVYTVNVEYETNRAPSLTLNTPNGQTIYEHESLAISGQVTDLDAGNVVGIMYSINGGTARTAYSYTSSASPVSFARSLTFRQDKLYDDNTAITGALAEGVAHTLSVWAVDDKGGRSATLTRTFNVVPNRPSVMVDGTVRNVESVHCMVDGQVREIIGIWTMVDGQLKEI